MCVKISLSNEYFPAIRLSISMNETFSYPTPDCIPWSAIGMSLYFAPNRCWTWIHSTSKLYTQYRWRELHDIYKLNPIHVFTWFNQNHWISLKSLNSMKVMLHLGKLQWTCQVNKLFKHLSLFHNSHLIRWIQPNKIWQNIQRPGVTRYWTQIVCLTCLTA